MTTLFGVPAGTVEVGDMSLSVGHVDNVLVPFNTLTLCTTISVQYLGLLKENTTNKKVP